MVFSIGSNGGEHGGGNGGGKPGAREAAMSRYERNLDPDGYCHTHGYKVKKGHTSVICSNPDEGHKKGATRAKPLGGSDANKDWKPAE